MDAFLGGHMVDGLPLFSQDDGALMCDALMCTDLCIGVLVVGVLIYVLICALVY